MSDINVIVNITGPVFASLWHNAVAAEGDYVI